MPLWDLCKQEQLDLIAALDDTELIVGWLEVWEEDKQDQHSKFVRSLLVAIGAGIVSHIDATVARRCCCRVIVRGEKNVSIT